jgi:chromosome segregation ATPase
MSDEWHKPEDLPACPDLHAEIERLQHARTALAAALTERQKERDDLRVELATTKQINATIQAELVAARNALAAERERFARQDATLEDAGRRIINYIAERKRLREALAKARESVAAWGAYSSDYMQAQHELANDLAAIDAVLAETGEPNDRHQQPMG